MQQPQQTIGLLGGTFDPIHHAHLRMAIEVAEHFALDKVHFIPCHHPVHRQDTIASPQARLEMIELAIADEPLFYADAREIRRDTPSYFIETLLDVRQEMPHASLCLLVGMDAFLNFTTWHRYREILQHAHLVIVSRPGVYLPEQGELAEFFCEYYQADKTYLQQHLAGGIFMQSISALEISANSIRKQIAIGKNPRYLLPDRVYDYLMHHSIY